LPLRKGIDFLCEKIEASDESSLYVTDVRGTRLQSKLGPYIDTFLATLLLSEVKGQMPDDAGNARVDAALSRVMNKIERNQRPDGTWTDEGWAPALSQAMASKAINRAAQSGVKVDEKMRERAEKDARDRFDRTRGGFDAGGSANVELYAVAAGVGGMQDSDNSNATMEAELLRAQASASSVSEREAATGKLRTIDETREQLGQAKEAMIQKLNDAGFVAGFGSNGGEEFLSYMTIGESLVVSGGPQWEQWDRKMTENLNRIQNADGSWTGHHCITGRTFCTSAALLVLTMDRAPVPLAAQMQRRS
jgi:hypothetical protein